MSKTTKRVDIRPFTRQFFRGNGLRFALAILQTILLTGSNLLVAWLIRQLLDLIAGTDSGFTLWQLTLMMVAFMVLLTVGFGCEYASKPRFIARAMAQYKDYVFQQLSKKSISALSGENSSLYISALSNDAVAIENNYLSNILNIIDQVILLVASLVMMFWYSPLLTVISIALSLLPVAVSILLGNRVAVEEKKVSDQNESYMSTLRDSLTGFSVIKSFRAEAPICRIFAESVKRVAQAKERRTKITVIVEMLSSLASCLVQLGVFLVGAYLVLSGKGMTAGTIMLFVQLLNYVLSPIANIPRYLAECKAARALIEKLAIALNENIREEGTSCKRTLERSIQLKGLCFAYEAEKPVLQNIDFNFAVGKSYAIVGASGSGKSTLLNLLLASHHSYGGSIRYDDTELKELKSEALYEMVSVVQQNVFIFNASIRDNITMFSDFPREEVDRAIALSGLSALIAERGEAYLCGENGSGLSGGEKQRISIARSLLKRSQVLLVDEATAALDAQTAYQVTCAILGLEGLTRIVVTHDLDQALLKQYDCILTLKGGSLIETGTFDELIAKKGYFYSLFTVSQ